MRNIVAAFGLLVSLSVLGPVAAVRADGEAPYPEFTAAYDVRVNGVLVGYANFALEHLGGDEYLYHSEAGTRGVASLFKSEAARESSRWRYRDGAVQVLEYRTQQKGGDTDDNAHLVFDWDDMQVKNIGAGEHWKIDVPEGTLDEMVMQLAMLFDLRDGKRVLEYPVAVRGRIKRYRFELAGEDTTELPMGRHRTLVLERADDSRDTSRVWSAPDLNYFPVRFVKEKRSGLKTEILLRELKFLP
jgi:hypothetical protein